MGVDLGGAEGKSEGEYDQYTLYETREMARLLRAVLAK